MGAFFYLDYINYICGLYINYDVMITSADIEAIGFIKMEGWSTDIVDSYVYKVIRHDKPKNTHNVYRLDRLIDSDYFELRSSLQREMDFDFKTYSFNGELETVDDLFELMEEFRELNRKI
jgi:hypothetical protein